MVHGLVGLAPVTRIAGTIVLLFSLGVGGCNHCDSLGTSPQYVIVVEDANSTSICDASVSVDSTPIDVWRDCEYRTPIPGGAVPVSLHVERQGYLPVDRQLSTRYESDSCGQPYPVNVKVVLERSL